jgi:SAM-dependent methyltransferase
MHDESGAGVYTHQFFAGQVDGSARSATVVVPIVLSLHPLKSVVDVGCGVGPWAAEFLARGVPDVWGVDGDYVDRSQLRIPSERFMARDLTKPLQIDRAFDLAVCLEVAEHLPESRAQGLVADLTTLAPCVLFSAALPGQEGTNHINEQYISYWAEHFRAHGFEGLDPIRPAILGNGSVEWFYQQNIVMFAAADHQLLNRNFPKPHPVIHPQLYELARSGRTLTLGKLARFLPRVFMRSIRYRLGRPSVPRDRK